MLPEPGHLPTPDSVIAPTPIDKDSVRSVSSSRHRPAPPPKDRRPSRPSMLHISASQPELAQHPGIFKRRASRRHQHPIISQLASLKHWFVESAKRARSPHGKTTSGGSGGHRKFLADKLSPSKSQGAGKGGAPLTAEHATGGDLRTPTQMKRSSNASSLAPSSASYPNHRHSFPRQPRTSHRNSLSPAPVTPRGSYRRSSVGLRGRKSTSSSISSIRSIHHTHSHSKASSISSKSIDLATTPTARIARSPHTSVKVLPTTPNASARFPSNIRLVRGAHTNLRETGDPSTLYNEAAPVPLVCSPSSSLVFARRKRSTFKGPMAHASNLMASGVGLGPSFARNEANIGALTVEKLRPATRKSQIIEEEEGMVEEEEIEEVDNFSGPEDVPVSPTEGSAKVLAEAFHCEAESKSNGGDGNESLRSVSPTPTRKPGLAPAPDLEASPLRSPRSSSLRAAQPEASDDSSRPASKSGDENAAPRNPDTAAITG